MALHGALPQVFAALGAGQLEHEGVLLFPALDPPRRTKRRQTARGARTHTCVCVCVFILVLGETNLIVVLHHDQRQSTLFKIQPGDFGPG